MCMAEQLNGPIIGNLSDKKEIKRLKKLGLKDREIRNLRDQQNSGGRLKNMVPSTVVQEEIKKTT